MNQYVIASIRNRSYLLFLKPVPKDIREITGNAEKGLQTLPAHSWPLHIVMMLQLNPVVPYFCCDYALLIMSCFFIGIYLTDYNTELFNLTICMPCQIACCIHLFGCLYYQSKVSLVKLTYLFNIQLKLFLKFSELPQQNPDRLTSKRNLLPCLS